MIWVTRARVTQPLRANGGEPEGEIFDIRVEFNWNWADGESERDFRRRQHDLAREQDFGGVVEP